MHNIPVLHVSGKSLAEAYENALVALHKNGVPFRTQYDKPGDPPSLDCTMNLTVLEPLSDPMIHKAFPGGIEDLKEYVMELQGLKDHWVKNMNDPKDTRWEYTYHGRLTAWGTWRELRDGKSVGVGAFHVDQVEGVIKKLVAQPFTRQAQMITWMPNIDLDCYDPPCLQSIWYRLVEEQQREPSAIDHPKSDEPEHERESEGETGTLWLNCNIRFRSNDAWGANFMNMFGFITFNKDIIAAQLEKRLARPVRLARMNWQADSYHIYGKDISDANRRLFDRLGSSSFEDRVYHFSDPMIREIYDESESVIRQKISEYDKIH